MRGYRAFRAATILGLALAGALLGAVASPAYAKEPGKIHCYGNVCHRVRTIQETHRLIGRTIKMEASYYDDATIDRFNRNTITSNGEPFDADSPSRISSSDLPDGTELLLRNPENGRTSHVRVNDFGPFYGSRLIDVTRRVAEDLGFALKGVTPLEVTIIAAPRPEEAAYRRNRLLPPTLGHIGVLASQQMADVVRRLIGSDRRLALLARTIDLPERVPKRSADASILSIEDARPVHLEVDTVVTVPFDTAALSPLVAGDWVSIIASPSSIPGRGQDFEPPMVRPIAAGAPSPALRPPHTVVARARFSPAMGVADLRARPISSQPLMQVVVAANVDATASGASRPMLLEAVLPNASTMSLFLAAMLASLAMYMAWLARTATTTVQSRPALGSGPTLRMADRSVARSCVPVAVPQGRDLHRGGSASPSLPAPVVTSGDTTPRPAAASLVQPAAASCIGPDLEIEGDVAATGAIRIVGRVRGDVLADSVEIAPGALVRGQVRARVLLVGGTLIGGASASIIAASDDARLVGDFAAASYQVSPGARLDGRIRMLRATMPAVSRS